MTNRNFIVSVVIAIALVSFRVQAEGNAEPHSKTCALGAFKVTQVASLYITQRVGRGSTERLGGARMFLPAQPGLTAEWIGANIAGHVASARKHAVSYDCPLDVPGATATVTSAGTGFWVNISAAEPEAANEILNRARRIVR